MLDNHWGNTLLEYIRNINTWLSGVISLFQGGGARDVSPKQFPCLLRSVFLPPTGPVENPMMIVLLYVISQCGTQGQNDISMLARNIMEEGY
jgi:hypothetical protein